MASTTRIPETDANQHFRGGDANKCGYKIRVRNLGASVTLEQVRNGPGRGHSISGLEGLTRRPGDDAADHAVLRFDSEDGAVRFIADCNGAFFRGTPILVEKDANHWGEAGVETKAQGFVNPFEYIPGNIIGGPSARMETGQTSGRQATDYVGKPQEADTSINSPQTRLRSNKFHPRNRPKKPSSQPDRRASLPTINQDKRNSPTHPPLDNQAPTNPIPWPNFTQPPPNTWVERGIGAQSPAPFIQQKQSPAGNGWNQEPSDWGTQWINPVETDRESTKENQLADHVGKLNIDSKDDNESQATQSCGENWNSEWSEVKLVDDKHHSGDNSGHTNGRSQTRGWDEDATSWSDTRNQAPSGPKQDEATWSSFNQMGQVVQNFIQDDASQNGWEVRQGPTNNGWGSLDNLEITAPNDMNSRGSTQNGVSKASDNVSAAEVVDWVQVVEDQIERMKPVELNPSEKKPLSDQNGRRWKRKPEKAETANVETAKIETANVEIVKIETAKVETDNVKACYAESPQVKVVEVEADLDDWRDIVKENNDPATAHYPMASLNGTDSKVVSDNNADIGENFRLMGDEFTGANNAADVKTAEMEDWSNIGATSDRGFGSQQPKNDGSAEKEGENAFIDSVEPKRNGSKDVADCINVILIESQRMEIEALKEERDRLRSENENLRSIVEDVMNVLQMANS